MKKLIALYLAFLCVTISSFAQENNNFGKISLTKIEESQQKSADQRILFSEIKPVSGTEFRLLKTETDKLGMKHRTYQQYYNGIKVQFGILKVHEKNGLRTSYNGAYFSPQNVKIAAGISKFQVESTAKRFMKSSDVFWLDDKGISKSNFPNPELLILPNRRTATLHLAYAIGIGVSSPTLKMGIVYVDAQTGKVLKFKNQVFTCFENKESGHDESHSNDKNNYASLLVSGTGAAVYSGSQSIGTTLDSSDYILYDQSRANTGSSHDAGIATKNGIATVNFNHDSSLANYNNSGTITDFTDANNNWTAAEMSSDEDQYALDAHWGAQVVYDYFDTAHGRDSYDDNDSAIVSYVHFGTDYTNAAWVSFTNKRGFMIYGDGGGSYTPLTSLDVAAHEIGHGITNNTAELDYELESGAINEGLSDIWAMVVENYANNNLGTSKNFDLINDENGGGTFRSMSNPNAYSLPDTYGGTYWYDVVGCTPDGDSASAGYNDYCGVHTNSGVLSYWFWLLSQGGSGTNDIGDAFSVTALGMDDAAAIAYRMQNTYLTATSDYADARAAGIQAAIDLFGDFCTTQEEAVTNAFYAVGVGNAWVANGQLPTVTTDITDQTACVGTDLQIQAAATDWTSKRWQVNSGSGWNNIGNNSTYSGSYNNRLTITPDMSLDGFQYRLYYRNACGTVYTSEITLSVNEYPVATIDSTTDETCAGNDGSITISFTDDVSMTNIDFSIDGGVTYPYSYLVNSGTQTISNLIAGTYNVWTRWDDDSCAVDLGDHILGGVSVPSATIGTIINETCALNDGSIEVNFSDDAIETQIDFSIDGGANYDYTFNDADGTGIIPSLPNGNYDVWVSYNGNCPINLGVQTIASDAPIATVSAIDYNAGVSDTALSFTFTDNTTQTQIKFSIDGGVNYDYTFNDADGTGDATGLPVATYNVWVIWGDDTCPMEIGDYTISNTTIYTAIPDVNFEAALDVLGYDDFLGDFQVPTTFINTVPVLNILSKNIADLTGIEDFSALQILDCGDNNLTSLDLSNNPVFGINGELYATDNNLSYLDLRNGNSSEMDNESCRIENNPNLTCVLVDDAAYSTTSWFERDNQTFFSETYCTYTAIPGTNFEAALDALGYDDITGDNQVPTALIENLTSLNVESSSISNLTGIEDFTSLTTLKVDYNNLEDQYLDLSANTALEVFSIRDNGSGITSLDLSQNLALRNLNCRDNAIIALDLSNNLALETLKCQFNNLTSLDVSLNTSLTSLTCQDNPLVNLNVQNGYNTSFIFFQAHNNPNLTCILVDNAAYCNGQTTWTDYIDTQTSFNDVACTAYTVIPDAIFETALADYDDIAGDGKVPTANIETLANLTLLNLGISDLTGIQDFAALSILNCNNNTLSTLDLSSNTNLTYLNCSSNNLTALDLSTNLMLTDLNCGSNQLTTLNVNSNSLLTNLDCSTNQLEVIDLSSNLLLDTLNMSYNTTLTALDVTKNTALNFLTFYDNTVITSINLEYNTALVTLRIGDLPLLTTLDVDTNVLLEEISAYDCEISGSLDVSHLPNLNNLDLRENNLSNLNVRNGNNANFIYFGALGNSLLTCISVDDVSHSTSDADWADVDAGQSFTETDYCRYTTIPDANFEAALEALGYDDISGDGQVPTALIEVVTSLDIRDLSISDLTGLEDFTALVTLLCRGNGIDTIDVSQNLLLETLTANNNSFGTIDLSNNTALKSVNLGANGLSTLDVSNNSLLEVLSLQSNGSLTTIDISNNTLLKDLKTYNSGISTLDISNNTALQTLQVYNTSIATIDVTNNPDLTDFRIHQTNITTLDLSNNPDIEQLRVNNTGIESLDLSNQVALEKLFANDMSLNYLNVQNGNNGIITTFRLTDNPSLSCILVDNAADSTTNWTEIDTGVTFSETYCRYTAIPDANFEAALDALGYDDITNDGQVPTALIEVVTILHVSSENISDLTGIEDFAALDDLNIQDNNLSSIDLSHNALLTDLNCAYNNFLSLDFSSNAVLNSLYANNCLLEQLDLSANTQLQYLYVVDNALTSLNYQNGNNLNSQFFNATGNSNLTCILVDDADYSDLNWGDIDGQTSFSDTYCDYTLIPDANFEAALDALGYDDISSDGQVPTALIEVVTNLDVSSESISNLTGIEDFTALLDLNIQDNSLSNVDLSSNLLLEDLNCAHNSFFYLDVSANTVLNSLYANNNWLIELDLSLNTQLQYLYVVDNQLSYLNYQNGNNTANLFFNATGNSNLTCILVDDVSYSTTNWTSIDAQTSFSNTYCRYTAIPDANFEAALEALGLDDITADGQVPTVLIENEIGLDVSNESISDLTGIEDFEALVFLTCTNNQLTTLDLSSNDELKNLDVSSNALNLLDLNTGISIAVASSNNLKYLDLRNHTSLSQLTVSNNELVYLNLQSGTNTNMSSGGLNTTNNPDLTCVLVDDVAYSTTNWTNIDATTGFSLTYCKYTQIPDSNFETRLENLGLDDISGDGQVPTGLIIDEEHLDVSFANSGAIYDLTGIEDFYSLVNLILDDNVMTSIDLSSNINLSYLTANNTGLTSIDLSQNTEMQYVILNDNSDLITVNFQNGSNTNLEYSSDFQATNTPNLTCVLVDDSTYSTTTWTYAIDPQITFNEITCSTIALSVKAFLQGAALNPNTGEETLMRDDLRVGGYVPTTSPYTDALTCVSTVFDDGGTLGTGAKDDNIVDWVWVELRDETDNTIIIDSQSGLLQRDGDVVGVDGISSLKFSQPAESYNVSVNHRSHLGVMSASAIALSGANTVVDLSANSSSVLGTTNAVVNMGGFFALVAGDFDENNQIQNTDINSVILLLGGSGYSKADADMNGQIQNTDINNILYPNVGKGQQF